MAILLRPTTRDDIHNKFKDNLWDLKAARILDMERIKAWLKEHASDRISGRAGMGNPSKSKEMRDAALATYKQMSLELEGMYDPDSLRGVDQILRDAQKGVFKDKAPSPSAIAGWFFSLLLSGSLEIGFFSYMVMYKGAGGLLIGIAVILLVGGLFAGHGLSSLMTNSQKSEYEATEVRVEKKYLFLLVLGVSLMVAVTALRYAYGGPLAGIIAALFGTAVTTTEAFLGYYRAMREYYLEKMFQAQSFYAGINLWKDLKERGDFKDDAWFVHFEGYVDEVMGSYKNITQGDSEDVEPEKKPGPKPPKEKPS